MTARPWRPPAPSWRTPGGRRRGLGPSWRPSPPYGSDQFQAVAEGRLDTAISTLRANIDAFRQAAIADDSEALETARPLLEDAKDDVVEAWAVVEALADLQCDAN
jgi:hypothetical protein